MSSETEASDVVATGCDLADGQIARLGWGGTVSTLSHSDFRMLMVNCLVYVGAIQIDNVARPWLAYSISGSALTLGLVTLAQGGLMMVFSMLGGVAADRFDKRKVLIWTQIALAVLATINALLVHLGIVEVWHLIVLGALQGAVFPLNFPARHAYVPELVAREELSSAITVSANIHNVNRVLAPAIAGLLIAWSPAAAFYAIAACMMPIATMPLGGSVDLIGVSTTEAAAGGILAIVVIAIALKYQAQWRLQQPRTISP